MIAAIPALPKGKLGEVGPYEKLDEWHVRNARGLSGEMIEVGERVDLREARGVLNLCEFRKFTFGSESQDRASISLGIARPANMYFHLLRNGRSAAREAGRIRWKYQ